MNFHVVDNPVTTRRQIWRGTSLSPFSNILHAFFRLEMWELLWLLSLVGDKSKNETIFIFYLSLLKTILGQFFFYQFKYFIFLRFKIDWFPDSLEIGQLHFFCLNFGLFSDFNLNSKLAVLLEFFTNVHKKL